MAKTEYSGYSPYVNTNQTNWYLKPIKYIQVPAHYSDKEYVIESKYENRPDLLSYRLYGTEQLWWILMVRNLNEIRDPLHDFKTGTTIYIPTKERIDGIIRQ